MISHGTKILSFEALTLVLKPTLNTPTINLNANGGILNVIDYKNGNFTNQYKLYLNGIEIGSFDNKSITMTDYGINESHYISILAISKLFNSSNISDPVRLSDIYDGTVGLVYNNGIFTGIGTAQSETIRIASVVNNTKIWAIGNVNSYSIGNLQNKTVIIPSTVTTLYDVFRLSKNCKFIFEGNFKNINANSFTSSSNCIYDWRACTEVLNIGSLYSFGTNPLHIVPDNLYEAWIADSKWNRFELYIKQATEYEKTEL